MGSDANVPPSGKNVLAQIEKVEDRDLAVGVADIGKFLIGRDHDPFGIRWRIRCFGNEAVCGETPKQDRPLSIDRGEHLAIAEHCQMRKYRSLRALDVRDLLLVADID